ncbi:MAG: saccharopine dehydrogenase C-terminal domain-containing protein [Sulfolobales archaeon]
MRITRKILMSKRPFRYEENIPWRSHVHHNCTEGEGQGNVLLRRSQSIQPVAVYKKGGRYSMLLRLIEKQRKKCKKYWANTVTVVFPLALHVERRILQKIYWVIGDRIRMKRVTVFGCGLIGFYIVREISNWEIDEVTVVDDSDLNLRQADEFGRKLIAENRKIRIKTIKKNVVTSRRELVDIVKGSLVGIGALPHNVSKYAMDICIEAKVNFVDIVYDSYLDDSEEINEKAKQAGISIIPAMGVAPGLSNVMVANGVDKFDEVESAKIYVGGIPETRIPPLDYKIVFSANTVVNEYIKEVKVRRNGEIVKLPAMSEVEDVSFFSYSKGEFEAFLTDGLSTLLKSFPSIPNMEEKTVRWKGHTQKLLMLKDLGLLSNDKIKLPSNGVEVAPAELIAVLFGDRLKFVDSDRDITLMKVEVVGTRGGVKFKHIQEMVDKYDEVEHVTSMARTTGITCSIVAQLLAEGSFKKTGLIAPESAVKGQFYEFLVDRLGKRGIFINEAMVHI